ncbi:MAG: hypothetical protein ABGY21_08580, partial [Pseudomonadota bacterium]
MSNSPLNIRNNPAVCWVTAQVADFTDMSANECTHCTPDSPPGQGDSSMYDLVLKQARVIDPQAGL